MNDAIGLVRLPERPTLATLCLSREAAPQPGPGEVALRVHASSLNYHDYLVAAGHIPQPAGRVPLSDGAGEVLALGDGVSGWATG
jgi:NADPH:quinone reductase-like Zn-dependent oxidoreductase